MLLLVTDTYKIINMLYFYTFLSVLLISLISFVGVFTLSLKQERLKRITMYLVSLSAGTLLGGAFFHLLPEIFEESGGGLSVWGGVLGGIIVFFTLEKIICWRHCHIPTSETHPHPLGLMNLFGDGLHNLLDGLIIAGAFMVDPSLGFVTTLAVIAHEIPQEIGDFGVLIHAGYKRSRALLLNFIISLSAFVGAGLAFALGSLAENAAALILPFAAGGFIYIATADLIPELKKDAHPGKSLFQLTVIILGIGLMLALKVYTE